MRKRQFLIILACPLFLFACSNNLAIKNSEDENKIAQNKKNGKKTILQKDNIKIIDVHANFKDYQDENSLFDDADLVVIAKTTQDFMDREHVLKYIPHPDPTKGKTIADFYTRTPIKITEVLKIAESSTIANNDNLNIIEPLSLIDDEQGLRILTSENYQGMEKGKQYILYLKDNTFGEYGVINMNNGVYNLEADEKIAKLAVIGDVMDVEEKHEKMEKVVLKKFEKEIKNNNISKNK